MDELGNATSSNPRIIIESLLNQVIELQKLVNESTNGATGTGYGSSESSSANLDGVLFDWLVFIHIHYNYVVHS